MNHQLLPNLPIEVKQYLGADFILNDGDAFSESFTFNFINSTAPNASVEIWNINELNFTLNLTGTISDVTYNAGIPDLGNDPGNFADNMAATTFKTNFNTTAMDSSVGMTVDYMGTVIGEFDVFGSVTNDVIAFDGSTQNAAFIFGFELDEVWAAANTAMVNDVWRKENGDFIDPDVFQLISLGAAGPNGTSTGINSDINGTYIGINVADNGGIFVARIPEPTSVALFGLALVGLAGSARRKTKK